jgi:PAS domain S-box-containing protein
MPAMAWTTLADGANIFQSKGWTEYTGLSVEESQGQGWQTATHPEDLKQHLEKWRASQASGHPFEDEVRVRRASDWEYRWFLARAVPLRDERGHILKWYGILTDIEDRKRAEQALREGDAKIRRLVDANIIGVWVGDLEGQIMEANDAFLHMVGYEREDLISGRMRLLDMTPPEWRARTAQRMVDVALGSTVKAYEKEYFRKDGSRVPVLVGSTFFGSANQGVAFVIDLTERKRAEAEARESERRHREVQMELAHANRVATMGQLTASIVHEVKQPIAATVTNAEAALRFLDAQTVNLDKVRQIQNDIMKAGNRAADVISRIHDLFKKAPPQRDRWEINAAISEVIEITHREAVKNGISVRTELADGLPFVQGDRVQVQQVGLNLIINAIQAMAGLTEGIRELHISTESAGKEGVRVAVRDSGPGLSADSLQRLFEPFFTTKPNGMGMGLSICRSIIEDHGGRLWATGLDPHGALFQFTIPAC